MRGSSLEKETNKKRDEVEEMLQAAQDQVLLKLSVDSHIASASSNNYLDSDLERRFKALKSGGSSSVTVAREDQEFKAVLGDDLSARFAALKAKLNPSSSSTIAAKQNSLPPTVFNAEDENEEDEVERLIREFVLIQLWWTSSSILILLVELVVLVSALDSLTLWLWLIIIVPQSSCRCWVPD
ncbi:transcription initiation factor TFIID subunit 11 isoform X3 [Senna tora]|uniref:Transcription initiation factor TFIID subunit 11 isoform X3 n=1 Tax=Senna tora TaxID=362788 RepID=A0A834TVN4_9FABA|nr:transcription initiation factor TFIID subunit 11 isoform X3 [Senna tora]